MGIHLLGSNFQPPCRQNSFPNFTSYTSFSEPPTEEKSELEKSIEVMFESQQQFQNMVNSQSSQFFQNQASYTPFLEHSIEEKYD